MNEELKQIFGDSISVKGASVPCAHLHYNGKARTYIVWSIISNSGELYADDELLYSAVTVDIDVFSAGNYIDVITEIKRTMKEKEWIWLEDSADMYEEDTALYHKTLTFTKEGE